MEPRSVIKFSRSYCVDWVKKINGECIYCHRPLQDNRSVVITSSVKHGFQYSVCCSDDCAKTYLGQATKVMYCCSCWQGQVTALPESDDEIDIPFCCCTYNGITMLFICCSRDCLSEVQRWPAVCGASHQQGNRPQPRKRKTEKKSSVGDTSTALRTSRALQTTDWQTVHHDHPVSVSKPSSRKTFPSEETSFDQLGDCCVICGSFPVMCCEACAEPLCDVCMPGHVKCHDEQ